MGWHPDEEDQSVSQNLFEMAEDYILMPQQVPLSCPFCRLEGRSTQLFLCKVTFDVSLLCCPQKNCIYPFNLELEQFQQHFLPYELSSARQNYGQFGENDSGDDGSEIEISDELAEEIRSRGLPTAGKAADSAAAFRQRMGDNMKELKRRLEVYRIYNPARFPSSAEEASALSTTMGCPECLERGVESELKLAKLSLSHGLLVCPAAECGYPLDQSPDVLSKMCVKTEVYDPDIFDPGKFGEAVDDLCNFIEQTLVSEASNLARDESASGNESTRSDALTPTDLENTPVTVIEVENAGEQMDSDSWSPLPVEHSNPVAFQLDGEDIVQSEGEQPAALSMPREEVGETCIQNEVDQSVSTILEHSINGAVQNENSAATSNHIQRYEGALLDGRSEKPVFFENHENTAAIPVVDKDVAASSAENGFTVDLADQSNDAAVWQLENPDVTVTLLQTEKAVALPTENEDQTIALVDGEILGTLSFSPVQTGEKVTVAASLERALTELDSAENKNDKIDVESDVESVPTALDPDHPIITAVEISPGVISSAESGLHEMAAIRSKTGAAETVHPIASNVKRNEYVGVSGKVESSERRVNRRRRRNSVKQVEPEHHVQVPRPSEGTSQTMPDSLADVGFRSQRTRRMPVRFKDYLLDDALESTPSVGVGDHGRASKNRSDVLIVGHDICSSNGSARRKVGGSAKQNSQTKTAKRARKDDRSVVTEKPSSCLHEAKVAKVGANLNCEELSIAGVQDVLKAVHNIPGDRKISNGNSVRKDAAGMLKVGSTVPSLPQSPSNGVSKKGIVQGRPPDKVHNFSSGKCEKQFSGAKEGTHSFLNCETTSGDRHELENCGAAGTPMISESATSDVEGAVRKPKGRASSKPSFYALIKMQLMNACAEAELQRANALKKAATDQLNSSPVKPLDDPSVNLNSVDGLTGNADMFNFDSLELPGPSDAFSASALFGSTSVEQQPKEAPTQATGDQSSCDGFGDFGILDVGDLDFSVFGDLPNFVEPVVEDELIL
uniref:Uncharacterized protein n=1 Tax=Trichuris muris TaxID=70415 RepID=A0A5S6QTE1_TRIMR